MDMDEFLKVLAEITALKERVGLLEEAVLELRSELDEMQNDETWIGGTD